MRAYILKFVDRSEYLPIITDNSVENYRSEFQETPSEELDKCFARLSE